MKRNWTKLKLITRLTIFASAAYATIAGSIIVCASLIYTNDAMAASVEERGRDTFEKRCTGCHDLDKIKVGPPLRGVYGRTAGKDARFPYSDAMKNAPVRWDESTLDRWLTDTDSVIPGNDMAFRLNDPLDRAGIIAYLRQFSGK